MAGGIGPAARWIRVAAGRLLVGARLRRTLPAAVRGVMDRLAAAGYPAYLVGGCVRDLILGRTPKDWDLATAAPPEAVAALFPRTVPFRHGTVRVLVGEAPVEVTTLRPGPPPASGPAGGPAAPGALRAGLACRDFTVNAMALDARGRLHDLLGGWWDLARGVIRGTGDPGARFDEDPLRMVRAVRLAAELQFRIDPATRAAIPPRAGRLAAVAPERIRDELARLLLSPWPAWGLEELRRLGLLAHMIPELLETVGVEQNRYHAYPVWEHLLLTVAHVPPRLDLRLAALFHDIAKPRCLRIGPDGRRHFYGHEQVGAEMAEAILERLRFDRQTRRKVVHLVRYHMDLHLDLRMSDAAILRMVARIGREHLPDLVALRRADHMAAGTKPGELGAGTLFLLERIRELEAAAPAFGRRDLALDGREVMAVLGIGPGPAVGAALDWLVAEVQAGRVANRPDALRAHLARWPGPAPPALSPGARSGNMEGENGC